MHLDRGTCVGLDLLEVLDGRDVAVFVAVGAVGVAAVDLGEAVALELGLEGEDIAALEVVGEDVAAEDGLVDSEETCEGGGLRGFDVGMRAQRVHTEGHEFIVPKVSFATLAACFSLSNEEGHYTRALMRSRGSVTSSPFIGGADPIPRQWVATGAYSESGRWPWWKEYRCMACTQRGDHLRVRRENQLRITIHISKQLDCLVREFPNLRIWIECPSGNDFWKLAE